MRTASYAGEKAPDDGDLPLRAPLCPANAEEGSVPSVPLPAALPAVCALLGRPLVIDALVAVLLAPAVALSQLPVDRQEHAVPPAQAGLGVAVRHGLKLFQ